MSLSRRDRRDLRVLLWVNLASAPPSACFGFFATPVEGSPWMSALMGIVTSALIATPIAYFELRSARLGPLRRLRRLPLVLYFAIKVLFYFVVIIGGLTLTRVLFAPFMEHRFTFDVVFEGSLAFAIGMSVVGNLAFEMGSLLGFDTLKSLLTGRYVQPKREQKVFLLIDMKNSTGIAEKLGPLRFHELVNLFFRDIADAALACGAEIHKYVGDEAILVWRDDGALADAECLSCPFIALDAIAANSNRYRRRFGIVPEFRAAMHCGEIVAGEIGDVRREIAYVGDTLNVAARLLEAAKEVGRDVLASTDLLERTALPDHVIAEPLRTLAVRGREAPLGIAALVRQS